MTIENVYKKLYNLYDSTVLHENNDIKMLLDEIEKDMRLSNAYKASSKLRVNGLKNIVKNASHHPVLQGFGVLDSNYNNCNIDSVSNDKIVVTDSYGLVCIKESIQNMLDMGLKLVSCDDDMVNKYGVNNVICNIYPKVSDMIKDYHYLNSESEEISLNLDDINGFYKLHKSFKDKKDRLYVIVDSKNVKHYFDVKLLKNVLDVICCNNNFKAYVRVGDAAAPMYIVNNNDEVGLVLPVKMF